MAVGFAASVVNGWLDGTFSTVWVKLHVSDPGATGAANAAAGDALRKSPTMATAAGGSKAMSTAPAAWTNAGTTEALTHISLWTASTAGTFNASAALTASQSWQQTNTFTLTSLTIAITPIAAT